jgi:hypothetical protein
MPDGFPESSPGLVRHREARDGAAGASGFFPGVGAVARFSCLLS